MEKRAHERIKVHMPIRYFCDRHVYSGKVKNLSEKGMFISTCNFLPCVNSLEVQIPLKREIAGFSAEIRRIEKISDSHYTMGIELVDPPENYLNYVNSLKYALNAL